MPSRRKRRPCRCPRSGDRSAFAGNDSRVNLDRVGYGPTMATDSIRPAFASWPRYNQRLRECVMTLTDEQLAIQPSAERWPLWASIGHTACQRVFWLCDFAGAPGAGTTPFSNAASDCPGDDDLEHVLDA